MSQPQRDLDCDDIKRLLFTEEVREQKEDLVVEEANVPDVQDAADYSRERVVFTVKLRKREDVAVAETTVLGAPKAEVDTMHDSGLPSTARSRSPSTPSPLDNDTVEESLDF